MRLQQALATFIIVLGFFIAPVSIAQPQTTAIVSMHGKWGKPPGPLAQFLESSGYKVVSPVMPWSRLRNYDVDYEQGLKEIHHEVQKLRSQSYKKIILIGHSFGANGALAYLTLYSDVDGIVLLAPGHIPETNYQYGLSTNDVHAAKALLEQGKSEEIITFIDPNSGNRRKNMSASARIYLSYFDPNGLANMSLSASRELQSVPVLCVMSSEDKISQYGEAYIFDKLKTNSKSKYTWVRASHLETPESSKEEVLEFIQSISQ